ncbi:MAG TPA: EAL domain-containing protein [Burkholderiaceae bacterium]|nr:EAL domain-containing protein [Burkholderiaceae bacterium]
MKSSAAPRLQRRIVARSLVLLLVVQSANLMLVTGSIDANARAAVATELSNGEKVFQRLIEQHSARLREAARLLAADYGFRSAISGGDRDIAADAVRNQSDRIGATLAVFISKRSGVVEATHSDAERALARLAVGLDDQMPARTQMLVVQAQPYVVVVVPVRAPALIGWIAMGFALDRSLLDEMQQLSALKVALVARDSARAPWQLRMSALEPAQESQLAARLPAVLRAAASGAQDGDAEIRIDGSQWSLRVMPLASGAGLGGGQVDAVLLRSLDEAIAPYWRLQLTLFGLTALGLAVFALGSVLTARRIVRPIVALSRSALRLGQGDYSEPIPLKGNDEVGDLARAFETMREGIRQREVEIGRLAYWDTLTGLPNRQWFRERVTSAAEQAHGAHGGCKPFSVLVLDVDRFKDVNDVLGHELGDHLLQEAARRLQERAKRCNAFLARLGGDEFAMLILNADAEQGRRKAAELLLAFVEPLQHGEHTVDLEASLGLASGPQHGSDADTLLRRAEIAMYAAKRTQAGMMIYSPSMDAGSAHSLSLLGELRGAIAHGELRLFLQPKVALDTGLVTGAEALLRWQHPQRGLVPPVGFIPFAEQTGYIRNLTAWVLEHTVQMLALLHQRGLSPKFSVNLSTRDLADPDLPARVEQLLSRGLPAQSLCLEITESAMMEDPQRALQTLQRLHDMGPRLSIDDFGTGYSSLAYLKRLPVHELKIDRSFVMNMERDLDDAKIVRSTIDLAHNLGLHVVAEGVETLKALKLLGALRCDEAQGYLVARPMPAGDFAVWSALWKPPSTDNEHLDADFAGML